MYGLKNICIIVLCIFLVSCSTCNVNKHKKIEKVDIHQIIKQKLGEKYSTYNNKSNSHVLYVKNSEIAQSTAINHIIFLILDVNEEKIIFEDSIGNANVFWLNDYEVAVKFIPGMITKENETNLIKYKFNVKTEKKVK